jgi:hypothetical protein
MYSRFNSIALSRTMLKINYYENLSEIWQCYDPSMLTFTYLSLFRPINTRHDRKVKVTVYAASLSTTQEHHSLHSKIISFRSCAIALLTHAERTKNSSFFYLYWCWDQIQIDAESDWRKKRKQLDVRSRRKRSKGTKMHIFLEDNNVDTDSKSTLKEIKDSYWT